LEQYRDGDNETFIEEVRILPLVRDKEVILFTTALTTAPKPRQKRTSELFLLMPNLCRLGSQATTIN